jgi:galactitol-specific phosphotransferase system IIC component
MIITSVFFCHHQLSYHHQLSVKSSFQMLQQACKLLTLDTPGNLIMCALGKLIFHSNLSIIYICINIFLYLFIYRWYSKISDTYESVYFHWYESCMEI